MSNFKFNSDALQRQLEADFKKIEREANLAAKRHSAPQAKAKAFAAVLQRHGVRNVNVTELEAKFTP